METILAITLVLLLALVLSGGLVYRATRWFYCRILRGAALSGPTKIVDTVCPSCNNINTTYYHSRVHRCVWGRRVKSETVQGGRGLFPNHVNCLHCGAVYKVW